jgi:hypothetical protein
MAARGLVPVQVGSALCALAVLVVGFLELAIYPLVGVLITLGGMALLLSAAAGLCGVELRKKQ